MFNQQQSNTILCYKMITEAQKQIGWLVFMLTPFVSMLFVHVFIPLYFTISTVPLLQISYNNYRISLQHHNVMSFSYNNFKIINDKLNKYYSVFNHVQSYFNNNEDSFMQFNTLNIQLNNALLFRKKIFSQNLSKNYTQPQSMWFSNKYSTIDQLDISGQSIFAFYLERQIIIRSLLISNHLSAILSLSTYIINHNQSMYFQFPSLVNDNLVNSSSNYMFTYYQSTMNNYLENNQSLSYFYEFNKNQKNKLIFCTIIINGNIRGINCMNLDLDIFGNQIAKQMSFIISAFTYNAYYIAIPITVDQIQHYFKIIQFNQDGTILINKILNASNYISENFTLNFNDNFYIMRNQYGTLVYEQIFFQNNFQIEHPPLILVHENQYLQTLIHDQGTFNSNINIFVIPIVVLIVIFTLITICVLKKIMNNLEDELIQIENKSNFIIEGDIHVQIQQYTGTQDIKQVYDGVRTINKLHRYSSSSFFSGHYASKIIKYTEALQFISSLNYDTGYVLQNLGQSYLLMQQYEKSIQCLKQSTKLMLNTIQGQYGTIDTIFVKKKQKKIGTHYKQLQLILIRRLFNLVHAYYIYLQNVKPNLRNRKLSGIEIQQKKKRDNLIKEALEYILLLKKSFYPEYTLFAQCTFTLFFEAKINLDSGKVQTARSNIDKAFKISEIYINNYSQIGKKLKQKGSKCKFFYLKNKMTSHSRTHPEIIKALRNYIKAKILLAEQKNPHSNDYEALSILVNGLKTGLAAKNISTLTLMSIRQILTNLKCELGKFILQSTQISRQCFNYKSSSEKQINLSPKNKVFNDKDEGQAERQVVLLVDCFKNVSINNEENQYFQQRAEHVYNKLIKLTDRVSIIKFNTPQGIKIQCSLTLKQSKQLIIRKQIIDSFQQKGGVKLAQNQIFEVFQKTIYRIKRLKSQKVILIFFKRINRYIEHFAYISRKSRTKRKRDSHQPINFENRNLDSSLITQNASEASHKQFGEFGQWIIQIIMESGISNCKICLFCNQGDRFEQFQKYFGLQDINRRLWENTKGINRDDNIIYVLSSSHKSDIDRILMPKNQQALDNHIFML